MNHSASNYLGKFNPAAIDRSICYVRRHHWQILSRPVLMVPLRHGGEYSNVFVPGIVMNVQLTRVGQLAGVGPLASPRLTEHEVLPTSTFVKVIGASGHLMWQIYLQRLSSRRPVSVLVRGLAPKCKNQTPSLAVLFDVLFVTSYGERSPCWPSFSSKLIATIRS